MRLSKVPVQQKKKKHSLVEIKFDFAFLTVKVFILQVSWCITVTVSEKRELGICMALTRMKELHALGSPKLHNSVIHRSK